MTSTPAPTKSTTVTLLGAYAVFCFLILCGIAIGRTHLPPGWDSIYSLTVPFIAWALLLAAIIHQGEKDGLPLRAWIRKPTTKETPAVAVGALAAAIAPVAAQLTFLLLHPPRDYATTPAPGARAFDYPSFLHDPQAHTQLMLALPTFIVIMPIVQEILWRGVLSSYLETALSSRARGYTLAAIIAILVHDSSYVLPDGSWLMVMGGIYLVTSTIAAHILRAYSRTLAPCIAANMLGKILFILLTLSWIAQHT